ncbi:phosphatidate cytidylyltransferase [Apilactobacillus xinyiensis]|uniref:Phosphatidate cytidylyltransferase n=1 Tax=Apilactobacillus xinyiensis TaxID=2841032 RepID=A0ABT0HZK8_9LACO|nr:phosphatidate cytidylyltransferase [Apilactobacillus xinyiensis]MCK8624023.1 phosphatidate cytidylyltransferase [Apilactobacillus xinyiensis]MCL0318240.1 phosphatidate cytidylyltransferase [Apilactobacillus xinyiensis]
MKQRVLTAIIALIIFVPIVIAGGIFVDIAGIFLGLVAMSEILVMKKKLVVSPEAFLAWIGVFLVIVPATWLDSTFNISNPSFWIYLVAMLFLLRTVVTKNAFSFDDAAVLFLAMFYIGNGFHYFIAARNAGLSILFYALLIVWMTDSGAYLIGRKIGKHKLAPNVSPNKTWEGSIGGSIIATIVGVLWICIYPIAGFNIFEILVITIILSIAGQFGDLVESALKRYYRVKDSGKILPGHGGILDRFDSLIFILPLLHLFGII